MAEKIFFIHPAASGRSLCRNCLQLIAKKTLRIGKNVPNPYDEEEEGWGDITLYYHVPCMFKEFDREKAKERKIKSPDDLCGFEQLKKEDRETVLELIHGESSCISHHMWFKTSFYFLFYRSAGHIFSRLRKKKK